MSLFPIPADIHAALPDGAHDFDFLQGEWLIRHRRLKERLVGSDSWDEFETPAVMQLILGGLGNIDQGRMTGDRFFEGVSLRLFDTADGLWRIYWIDSTGARLFPPLIGAFTGAVGIFRGDDEHLGTPVKVTFRWDKSDPQHPTWEQAFSADNKRTWETNWIMHFRRPDEATPAPCINNESDSAPQHRSVAAR